MDVIADFPAYPQWAKAVQEVTILDPGDDAGTGARAKAVRFVLDAGVVKDTYELAYDWSADGLAVAWHLTKGEMQKAQRGSYSLTIDGSATTVTYELTVDLNIPMIGMFKRKAERVITDTALKELKKRVEG